MPAHNAIGHILDATGSVHIKAVLLNGTFLVDRRFQLTDTVADVRRDIQTIVATDFKLLHDATVLHELQQLADLELPECSVFAVVLLDKKEQLGHEGVADVNVEGDGVRLFEKRLSWILIVMGMLFLLSVILSFRFLTKTFSLASALFAIAIIPTATLWALVYLAPGFLLGAYAIDIPHQLVVEYLLYFCFVWIS